MSSNLQAGRTARMAAATATHQGHKQAWWKHWKWMVAGLILIALLFGWRGWIVEHEANAPAREAAGQAAVQEATARAAKETSSSAQRSALVYLTLAKGECSEEVVVRKGLDITSYIVGNVRQETRIAADAEWTLMVNGSTFYATRYCGDGQVSYEFHPTP